MSLLTETVTDTDGYAYVQATETLAQICLVAPCSPLMNFPDYHTTWKEVTIDGHSVVIQLWKGQCEHFMLLPGQPGGVGGEVGVYHRIAGKAAPARLPVEIRTSARALRKQATAVDLWWPYPDLNKEIEFELTNPRTGDTFFKVGPRAGAGKYWLSHLMTFSGYEDYKKKHAHPDKTTDYRMTARVGGVRIDF